MPLDWAAYMAAGMALVEGATRLTKFVKSRPRPNDGAPSSSTVIEDLEGRVAALESHEVAQGDLLKDLAMQVRDLTLASRTLSRKLSVAYVLLSVVAVGLIATTYVALR